MATSILQVVRVVPSLHVLLSSYEQFFITSVIWFSLKSVQSLHFCSLLACVPSGRLQIEHILLFRYAMTNKI